jgi:cholesterol oxidase
VFSALLRVACALGLLLTFTLTLIMESNTPNDPEVSFDAIVIGSGYGGSVSAYRLAKAGLKVAVIESGYAHKAPNILRGEASQWNPAAGLFGPHTVTHLSNTVTAWTGTAVGGGSIVNAAVMIRKDNFENWPGNISRQALEPYYDRAEAMLGAKTYPVLLAPSPYSSTIKSKVMLEAGRKLGVPTVMPPVAITYRETDEPVGTVKINQFGAAQQGCRQCGECSLPGCNYQAKNSLDFNYLYGAQHQFGAVILPGQKADIIEPLAASSGGGYRVTTIDSKSGVQKTYRAKVVVVAAGAVGSSQLLLRNKLLHKTLPALSARLGQQYTTNGTYIGFATRSKTEVDPSGGPEITAGLDFNGPDGKNQGVLMFDGSFRGFTYDTFYITGRLIRLNKLMIKLVSAGFALAEKVGLVRPATTLPLLVIGRDNAVGQFSLNKKGLIQTDLKPQDNASFYKRADEHLRAFTKAMGTRFLPFPYWKLQSKIDVPHNLGGVPMGSAAADGVVDHFGRVFGYDNLFVLDGSIIPATMGANPALTIAALAERSMEHVVPELLASGVSRAEEVVAPRFAPARDLTEQFHRLHEQVKNGAKALPTPEALKGKTVLFTPGFLARAYG